jgi:oligopeptide/dipeptide ABC transporter ATP-binding protein
MSGVEPVLSVSGLRTVFAARGGVVTAVRDVDLNVSPGEKVGIVGESGSGKSALALSILGLIEPPGHVVGGSVRLKGQEISTLGERELGNIRGRDISIVFQDPLTSLNPVKKIGAQLYEAIRRHHPGLRKHEIRRRSLELLHDVEISSPERRLDDFPHHYSGGMRQRVLMAIALANRPAVLIADEPTTALDTTTQAHVLWLLDRLVTEHGTAVILITHNLGVVAEFCDSVHVMYAGRFVESASTNALFANQVHPYTEALLGSILRPDRLEEGPLAAIPGAPPNLAELPPGCPFEPRCAYGNGREVCRTVRPVPVSLGDALHGSAHVECHFAAERGAMRGLAGAELA